eukprot:COSAG02_NODE_37676_length_439_cov_0.555882_1_plen_94_part_10
MRRSTCESKVIWTVRVPPPRQDGGPGCVHVNLVQRRADGVPDEQEYLFVPYSVFTVFKADWKAGTSQAPHEITLVASSDNQAEPEDLALAPWS